jgi:hypothetical protein
VQGGDDNAPEHAARIPGRPNHAGALRWRGPKVFLKEHGIAVGARIHLATDIVRCVVMEISGESSWMIQEFGSNGIEWPR